MYSQGGEEKVIVEYFDGYRGTFLDIGAFDGKTFSNTKRLSDLGWRGVLVEPAPKPFFALIETHKGNKNLAHSVL